MTAFAALRLRAAGPLFLALMLASEGSNFPAHGQAAAEIPDIAALEAAFEQAFAAALDMTDEEPMWVMEAWGTVMMSAAVLDGARIMAEGGTSRSAADSERTSERVLQRWQQLRPEAGGPDLFRAFRIQEPAEKGAAVVALLDRHPDDLLVVSQAAQQLRQGGGADRATEVLESYLARNPARTVTYILLARDASGNKTRQAVVLQRWGRAVPGDPRLVSLWMGSDLPRGEPEATARLLVHFFARPPSGESGLSACLQVARRGSAEVAAEARACVARVAADPDSPPRLAQRATSALVELASADGQWSALVAALDRLKPEARGSALIAAAGSLEAPARCAERIELLTLAAEALEDDVNDHRSIASTLWRCAEYPAAQTLFFSLLRQGPADQSKQILTAWVHNVNGMWRGELPPGVAGMLEQRLVAEPDAVALFQALDIVYQLEGGEDEHFDLLRRWYERAPASLRGEQELDLAWELVERAEPGRAVEILQEQLERRFDLEVASLLWELFVEAASPERAERFATELIATGEPRRVRAGHWLAARSAVLRGDLDVAEGHYWQSLEGDHPRQEVAIELLRTVGLRGDTTRLEAVARQICEETTLAADPEQVTGCAGELLAGAGGDAAAARFLAAQAEELPSDLESLRKLASTAQSVGQEEIAERALRRILELDPRDDAGWTNLGVFLEKAGRVEELEELLERSREHFSPPHSYLYRSTGRALTAGGQPWRAIDVLREALGTLPDTAGGEWSRSWINHELREAYRVLGTTALASAPRRAPEPERALPTSQPREVSASTAAELRAAADDLQSGRGGRYDPAGAGELYARAASMGDPLATFRLALLRHLRSAKNARGEPNAEQLYRRSAPAVQGLASEGHGYAQYLVGTAALIGLGGPQDPATARPWLESAATQGLSWAWHNLAWMEETGRGFEFPDPGSALASYRRACEGGNTQSMVELARLTLTANASGPLCQEGLQWLERSGQAGNARAAAFLGKLLFHGRGECVARDPSASLAWLEAGAAASQPGASYDLAVALISAAADEESRARGLSLLRRIAERPDSLAVETLAFLHATGIAVHRDPALARRLEAEAARLGSDGFPGLLAQAGHSQYSRDLLDRGARRLETLADRGDSAAAAFLARFYSVGLGRQADPEHTLDLARAAAAQGEASAMRTLYYAYNRGQGIEADEAEAFRWLRQGAAAGDSFCMMFLGNALLEGKRVQRDLEAGLEWLLRSGTTGNWWAIGDLGRLYDEGWHGLPRDPAEAVAWKRRFADVGDPEATGWLLYHGYR